MIKNSLNRLLRKYYWMPIIALAVLGSGWLSLQAWSYLHTPQVIDIFWNPTLQMWEPIYAPATSELANIILGIPVFFMMWWYSPVYFQIPYTLSLLYLILLFWERRPCIDASSGREKDEKQGKLPLTNGW